MVAHRVDPTSVAVCRLVLRLLHSAHERPSFADESFAAALPKLILAMLVVLRTGDNEPMNASQIAREIGMSRGTASRYLNALVDAGYVETIGNAYVVVAESVKMTAPRIAGALAAVESAAEELRRALREKRKSYP